MEAAFFDTAGRSEVQTGCVAVKQARQEVFKLPAGQCFVGVCGFCAALLSYLVLHKPCRLQYARAYTSVAHVLNSATGFSPGFRYLRITLLPATSSIHSM